MGAAFAYGVAVDGARATVWCSDHYTLDPSGVSAMTRRAGRAAKKRLGGRVFAASTDFSNRHADMEKLAAAFAENGFEVTTRRIEAKGDRRAAQFEAGYAKWHEGHEKTA